MRPRPLFALLALVPLCLGLVFRARAQIEVDTPSGRVSVSPQAYAARIEKEVSEIRGLPFKKSIDVENQSLEDFEKYLDAELDRQLPPDRALYYGLVVRRLGLYNGPVIEDFKATVKDVMISQAGAYYDPEKAAFYVLMQDMPEVVLGAIYAHELYHGLQDQYFDLDQYLRKPMRGALNDDQLLARQSVVEGEATYIMTLWTMKAMSGALPDPAMLDAIIGLQAGMDTSALREMMKGQAALGAFSGDLARAADALDDIPPFMVETLIGAYLKGLGFIAEIKKLGWEKVADLYRDPPASSEQILHPEKWLQGEAPFLLQLPPLDAVPALDGWRVIDQNVLGELAWRSVFAEQGLAHLAESAAAGWNGDAYAVLKADDSPRTLLLLFTSWDSPEDAREFHAAYLEALQTKYAGQDENPRVQIHGQDVLSVEGADPAHADALLQLLLLAEKNPQPRPEPR